MSVVDETLNAINNDAEALMSDICATVMEGGTLVALCARARPLKFKLINRWIAEDKTRQERYDLALSIREQHAKDLIIAELTAWLQSKAARCVRACRARGWHGGASVEQRMKPMQDWPPELQRLVAAIEFEELFEHQGQGKDRERVHIGRIHKIKFYDKPKSVETFMKHLAMLVDRKIVDTRVSLADLIAGEEPKASQASHVI
jgi:hypothetical protein